MIRLLSRRKAKKTAADADSSDEIKFDRLFGGDTFIPKNHGLQLAEREKKEKVLQHSPAQRAAYRARTAVRTAQINFRCSPKFKSDIETLREARRARGEELSVADLMEIAIASLAREDGVSL